MRETEEIFDEDNMVSNVSMTSIKLKEKLTD